jgi:hypothetical protein
MSKAIQEWIDKAVAHPAVAACGAQIAGAVQVKSRRVEVPEARVTEAMKVLAEARYFLEQNGIFLERLQWTFEDGLVCCACGRGGVMAALVMNKGAATSPDIERLLAACPLTTPGGL